ncbi:MAG: formylmethanofuran dehydrogenase [Chloroflexi bacterium]|nr:MAG: formylmethanofuran dehydrogenase [Chloroflexota bacterium]HDN80909.1 formylmethanofuran dehydrogenase [Chloroflexota bacterium]
MSAGKFILITGRTSKQGRALHTGKDSPEYLEEVSTLEMNEADMEEMGLKDGDEVRVRSKEGEITVRCRRSDSLPRGIIFIPYGPPANTLIGVDTDGTGMPDSKGIEVEICK